MRSWLVLAMLLAVPVASGEGSTCEPERTSFHPDDEQHLWVDIVEQRCDQGDWLDVSAQDPDGRTHIEWYDDERGQGFAVYRSPRFVYWAEDDRGCLMAFSIFGAMETECIAGAPPPPPALP